MNERISMSDVHIDVNDLLDSGLLAGEIAKILHIPVEWVHAVIKQRSE